MYLKKYEKKINSNKFGKKSIEVDFLLRNKIKCGYCGYSVMSDSGTAHNGEKKYYYKCRGRKAKLNDCHNKPVRKEVMKKIVIDSVIKELSNPKTRDYIVFKLMEIQEERAKKNVVLNLLQSEKRTTETAINNIMSAIEQGGSTNTAMKRMRELEQRQDELEKHIAIEKSKTVAVLTKKEINNYYEKALQLNPKLLVNYLIKEIVLFEDKIEIYYNSPIPTNPDESRGFSFASEVIEISYSIPFRKYKANLIYTVIMYIQ